jgi:predicted transcriptional regulator
MMDKEFLSCTTDDLVHKYRYSSKIFNSKQFFRPNEAMEKAIKLTDTISQLNKERLEHQELAKELNQLRK